MTATISPPASPEVLRRRVHDIASRALVKGDPADLTVRDIAAAAGCSTMMIYTLFGGKAALVESVYREGFERLQATLAREAPTRDPIESLRRLAQAYRTFGLERRALYAAMFSRPIASAPLRGTNARLETSSFATLLDAVTRAIDAGALQATHAPRFVADIFWSAVHGHVSLEISGHFSDDAPAAKARFEALVDAFLRGLSVPPLVKRKR